jgi:hypothetical protein
MAATPIDNNTVVRLRIRQIDGTDTHRVTLGMFLQANEDLDVPAIEAALLAGKEYRGGGGASPEWSIRRTA